MNVLLEFEKEVNLVLEKAEKLYSFLTEVSNKVKSKHVNITFFTEGGAAGYAISKRKNSDGYLWASVHLKFNTYMIYNSYETMVKEVIAHEVAHLVTHVMYDSSHWKHSKTWEKICIELGGAGKRYHEMKYTKKFKKIKYYVYEVDSLELHLPEKDHLKAQKSFTNFYAFKQMRRVFKENYKNKTIIKELTI